MNSSFAIGGGLVLALAAGGMSVALAQKPVGLPDNYPNKSVRIIINMAPGGAIDNCGRAVATLLSKRWGSPVIAENIAGGDGVIAMTAMTRAAPDGYTLLTSGSSTFSTAELVEKVPYNVRTKFPPIVPCTFNAYIVAVNNDLPVRNIKEFIAFAKANPNKLNYAYTGAGALPRLFSESLKIEAGIDMQGIPFKGGSLVLGEQMAGRINLTVNGLSAIPLIKSGKIRAIAITSEKRTKALPDVPTMRETLPNFDLFETWVGVVGIEGMSPALVNGLHRDINAVLRTSEAENMFFGVEVSLS